MKRIVLLSTVFLAACTPQGKENWRRMLTGQPTQQQLIQDELSKQQHCANMGAPKGSPSYYDCRRNIEQMIWAAQMSQPTANDLGNNALRSVGVTQPIGPIKSTTCTTRPEPITGNLITECR